MRVLYVEDHAEVRELIVLLLEEEGLSVMACDSAEAAQTAFATASATAPFDILMTDVSLPTMPGTELATRLQRDHADLWVVFCSGYSMRDGLKAWGPRARSLTKPFEVDELHALMAEILASAGAA